MDREKTLWDQCIDSHGHVCVGLALGFRAVQAAMKKLRVTRDDVWDLIVLAENKNCGLDVIPPLTGCTFGQHKIIVLDYGKEAYRIGNKKTGEAVRAIAKSELLNIPEEHYLLRKKVITGQPTQEERDDFNERTRKLVEQVLTMPEDELCKVEKADWCFPKKESPGGIIPCAVCGENTIESNLRVKDGEKVCIPCSER